MSLSVFAYIDGACLGNPGAMGCGVVLLYQQARKELSFPLGHGTNQRAEIHAAIKALEALTKPCTILLYSDSEYLIRGATGVNQRGANADLWTRYTEAAARHIVSFEWVKGHSGNYNHDRADALALMGAQQSKRGIGL
jgi:ribonuclease HI